jgi:hypothetical protein
MPPAGMPACCTQPDSLQTRAADAALRRRQLLVHARGGGPRAPGLRAGRGMRPAATAMRCLRGGCSRGSALTATCDRWVNGKSIRSIDTSQASIARGAKTDSDLARPPSGGDHPAAQDASPSPTPLTRSEARRGMLLPGRLGPGPTGWRTCTGGLGADPGQRRLSGVLAHSLIR